MRIPASKRLQEIVDSLEKEGFVNAKKLSEKYAVSMETIRKDLIFLEEKGIAKKEYGGASLAVSELERNIEFRKHRQEEKKEIARYVASLLMEYHSVIIDAGSTCQSCCEYINLLPSKDIFTNAVNTFQLLNGDIHNVFLLPGKKREKNNSIVGNWTEEYLDRIKVDVCLLGTSGLLDSDGVTCHSYQEITTKKKMIERSDLVFVLADSSKFYAKGLHMAASWDKIDGVITDHRISPQMLEKMSKKVPVYVAGEEQNEKNSESVTIL